MERITIERLRASLKSQILEELKSLGQDLEFEGDPLTLTLSTGQQVSCDAVRATDNGNVVLDVGIINIMNFEISLEDLSTDSIADVLGSFHRPGFSFDIMAVCESENGCEMTTLYQYPAWNIKEEEALRILCKVMPLAWELQPNDGLGGVLNFTFYPDKSNKNAYLIAHFY